MVPIEFRREKWSPRNPLAPPDWRFRLAREYVRRGIRPSFHDDRFTRDLYQFLRKRQSARAPDQRVQLSREYPALKLAVDLYQEKPSRLRPVLEAYLLTELDVKSISKRFGLPDATVAWFRRAFYDVRHLIAFPIRVLHQLIGVVDESGEAALDNHKVWKLVAYTLKSEGLDQLLSIDADMSLLPEAGIAAWLALKTRATARIKQLISVCSLNPADPKSLHAISTLASPDHQDRRREEAKQFNHYERHVQAMLEDIPWSVGVDGEKQFEGTEIGKLDQSAVELRDDDLFKLAMGQEVPGLNEMASFTLPPPEKRKPKLDRNDSLMP